jgi:hypothetical protein
MNDDGTARHRSDLAKDLLGYLHTNILHLDDISIKMKTWAITAWLAIMGLSLGKQAGEAYWLAYAALGLFWLVDCVYKYYQEYFFDKFQLLERYLVVGDFTKALPIEGITDTPAVLRTGKPTVMPNRHLLMVFKRVHFHLVYVGMLTITLVLSSRVSP